MIIRPPFPNPTLNINNHINMDASAKMHYHKWSGDHEPGVYKGGPPRPWRRSVTADVNIHTINSGGSTSWLV